MDKSRIKKNNLSNEISGNCRDIYDRHYIHRAKKEKLKSGLSLFTEDGLLRFPKYHSLTYIINNSCYARSIT